MTTFCEAKYTGSPNGCYELADHHGAHRGYRVFSDEPFFWSEKTEAPEAPVYFTEEELFVVLGALSSRPDLATDPRMTTLKGKLHTAIGKALK